jgi:DNA-binding NarL/FixJ family response regulator
MSTSVLTVDDDRGFRSMLQSLLSKDPDILLIGEAENGEDAARTTRELHPDIVLLDITMPRANGFDATRLIKAYRPETKIIILTVHADDSYKQAAIEIGADAFIAKKRLSSDLLPTIHLLAKSTVPKTRYFTKRADSILLIDNDAESRNAMAEYLRSKISAVIEECPSNEKDVLAKASTLRPNVVVVDWQYSGTWIVECLRGLFPYLGIIALTTSDSDGQKTAVFAAGADAAVAKTQFKTALLPIIMALSQSNADATGRGETAGECSQATASSAAAKGKPVA